LKRALLVACAAFALPLVPAAAAECSDLPVNVACQGRGGYCDVYKRPHPRLGAGFCLRVTQ
jgi:hypothetical protein